MRAFLGSWSDRCGVTLMEVILSIAVILTGLVGITALVPIAARNAQVTMELDRSVSESSSAAVVGSIRSFNDLDRLVIMDKPVHGSAYTGTTTYVPSNALQTVGWKTEQQTNFDPPVNQTLPTPPFLFGKLESPGYSHMPLGSGLSAGICIDPLGMPDMGLATGYVTSPSSLTPFNGVDNTDSAFNHSRFPYFNERYNPLAAPNDPIGNPAAAPFWPMAPRMWRATIKAPMYTGGPPPARRHQLLCAAAANTIFRGTGGASPFAADDDDAPVSMLVSQTTLGGSIVDSSNDSSSEYSWFATLAPPFLGGDTFRQSIVVVRQRQAPVPIRQNDTLALQKNAYAITDADDNPSAERLTWIDPLTAIGFSGGAGGDVMIYGSQAVSDSILAGEWVMFSRQPHLYSGTLGPPTGPAVHRWYRVLRVEEPETDDAFVFVDGSNYPVWRRHVTLAGPDWAFQDEDTKAGENTTGIDDTFCTIVTGAVSVSESEVQLQ